MTPTERGALPAGARTRFAPAPTGYLHLGHVANAIWVWGLAARARGSVLLRIEDHDRGRSRPEFVAALLENLAWLGFEADDGPVRQTDDEAPYTAALDRLATANADLRLRLRSDHVRGPDPRARSKLAWAGLSGRLSRTGPVRPGPAHRTRRWVGTLAGRDRRAMRRRGRVGRRHARP